MKEKIMRFKTTVQFKHNGVREIEVEPQEASINKRGNIVKLRRELIPCLTMAMMSGKITYAQYKDCSKAFVTLSNDTVAKTFEFNKRHRGQKGQK